MPTKSKRVKIWYQSFVDPDQQAAYCTALAQALKGMSEHGVAFDVHGIMPPDLELHRLTEFRCVRQVIRHAVEAQQQGYDAFAIGHFQDGGWYKARATVDIPVLGLGEALVLSTLCRSKPVRCSITLPDSALMARVIASAASIVTPSTKTARRRKRACSSAVSKS